MNYEETAATLLDLARRFGADQADVMIQTSEGLDIGVRGEALEQAERAESLDIGLRAIVGARQACVSASNARKDTLSALAERAVAMAKEAPEDPWCALPEKGSQAWRWPDLESDPARPAVQELKEQALAVEAAARGVTGVSNTEGSEAGWRRMAMLLADTNGFTGGYDAATFSLSCSAIAGEGLGMETDYAYKARRFAADMPDPASIGRLAGERAVKRLNAQKAPGGKVPVLYEPRVASSLIGHFLGAINGSSIARGSSFLREKLGERVFPENMVIREDPHVARGMGSQPFDDEGMEMRAKDLVRDGVIQTWLLDCATARQLGMETTGNALRGPGTPPSPGATNIIVEPGDQSPEDIIKGLERGFIVTQMLGYSVNMTTGDYSRGAAGFWVENGEIVHSVSEATVAGNLNEMFAGLTVANDADPMRRIDCPSLLVEGCNVSAS